MEEEKKSREYNAKPDKSAVTPGQTPTPEVDIFSELEK
jgi:hypothetical protein